LGTRFAQAMSLACNAAWASERAVFKSGAVTRTTENFVAAFIVGNCISRREEPQIAFEPLATGKSHNCVHCRARFVSGCVYGSFDCDGMWGVGHLAAGAALEEAWHAA
jgi:hypothetical protein